MATQAVTWWVMNVQLAPWCSFQLEIESHSAAGTLSSCVHRNYSKDSGLLHVGEILVVKPLPCIWANILRTLSNGPGTPHVETSQRIRSSLLLARLVARWCCAPVAFALLSSRYIWIPIFSFKLIQHLSYFFFLINWHWLGQNWFNG